MLRTYKKKLESVGSDIDLDEIEGELMSVLNIVTQKQRVRRTNATTSRSTRSTTTPNLKRSTTVIAMSPGEQRRSGSTTGSEANSPIIGSTMSKDSNITEKAQAHVSRQLTGNDAGLGVDRLSILMERTKLAEA